MTTTIVKWVNRCLGWILIGCVALAAVSGYILHKKRGYGTIEVRVSWRDKTFAVGEVASSNCELLVGGKRLAWTPGMAVRLRPGPAVTELRVKGFRASSASVGVTKDATTVAEFRLEAEPRTITVNNVKSNGVVNGKPSAGTWVLQGAEVGRSYSVEVAAPGFHTNLLSLQIEKPGEDLVTNLVWRPLMGFVRVSVSPPVADTAVTVDGAALDPLAGGFVELGVHTLSVSNGGYYPYNEPVEVSYGATNLRQVLLKPRPAFLKVEVNPGPQYEVSDDSGTVLALQGDTVELSPGRIRLTVSAKGCAPQQREFVIGPNGKYSWKVNLEKQGVPEFKRAEAQFRSLTNANWRLLEDKGGRDWKRIRDTKFDDEDLVEGAKQYAEACTNVTLTLEATKALDGWKKRFELLATNANDRMVLEQFGGADWQQLRLRAFDSEDPAQGAQDYKEAYSTLTSLVVRCYELKDKKRAADEDKARKAATLATERRDQWDRAQSLRNRINQLFATHSGDASEWFESLSSASRLVSQYEQEFGEGTKYNQWFGSIDEEVREWRRRIELSMITVKKLLK